MPYQFAHLEYRTKKVLYRYPARDTLLAAVLVFDEEQRKSPRGHMVYDTFEPLFLDSETAEGRTLNEDDSKLYDAIDTGLREHRGIEHHAIEERAIAERWRQLRTAASDLYGGGPITDEALPDGMTMNDVEIEIDRDAPIAYVERDGDMIIAHVPATVRLSITNPDKE